MSRPRASAGFALLALALLASCTGPPRVVPRVELGTASLEGWLEIRSPHFVLTGDVPREELERFAGDLAVFVAVVERITNASAEGSRVPARIYLVRGAVEDALKQRWNLGGYMAHRLDGYYGVVGHDGLAPVTREVLLHEYAHFLMRKGAALDYPLWYDEGFAEVVSTTRRREDLVTVGEPPVGRLDDLLGRRVDLESVLSPRERSDIARLGQFYATAWALTHYLATNGDTLRRMERLVELQARGVPWQNAYARAFELRLRDLEGAVRRHVDALARGALPHLAMYRESELPVRRDFAMRQLAPPEVARELGGVSLAVFGADDRGGAAAAFFERALEIDPGDSRSRAGLAVANALQDHFEAALDDLSSASAALPDDPTVLIAAGRVHRLLVASRDEDDVAAEHRLAARTAYARATQVDPHDPNGWAGLGWSYVGGDDPAPGIEALLRARREGAWDGDVSLDLGRLYHQAGNRTGARALWMQVARLGDDEQVEEARRLLEGTTVPDQLGEERR